MIRTKKDISVFRVNQVGFAAGLPVRAAVLAEGPVRLTDANGNTVRDISFSAPEPDEASGDLPAAMKRVSFPSGGSPGGR